MDYEFIVFGKENCSICKNRVDFLNKFKDKQNIDIKIKYKDIENFEHLSELVTINCLENLNIDIEKIPIVIMQDSDEKVIKTWSGYERKDVPTTPEILKIITERNKK